MPWSVEVRLASRDRARPGDCLVAFRSSPAFPTLTVGDAVFVDGERFRVMERELHVDTTVSGTAVATVVYLVAPPSSLRAVPSPRKTKT